MKSLWQSPVTPCESVLGSNVDEISDLLNKHRRVVKGYNETNTTAYKYACLCNPEDGIPPYEWADHVAKLIVELLVE